MKKTLLSLLLFCAPLLNWAQCTLTNATTCKCRDSLQTDCDLLPDITCSKYAILTYNGGPAEYSQTSGLPNQGRLTVTGSTPNLGWGPLEVRGVDRNNYKWYLCGTDTVSNYDPNSTLAFTCPNGVHDPKQLVVQRIYHKNGNIMTFSERLCGSMTYHPQHGHYHVDDWEIYTLRIPTADPNPLHWPIVGQGHKVGFCLEDYGDCSTALDYHHCQDSLGNYLTNASFGVQYNLDGNYGCSPVVQGIGVGHLDIYWNALDGQWIPIPPGTCNGLYAMVIQIDPNNYFLESSKTNNVNWDYWTLTKQVNANPTVTVTSDESGVVCQGDSITLSATAGTAFSWSTGDTTQTIRVPSNTMDYACTVTTYCGTVTSAPFHVIEAVSPPPSAIGDTVCVSGNATLTASGTGNLSWYDSTSHLVGTGPTFITPVITASTTYYVANNTTHNDTVFTTPADYEMSSGNYTTASHYLVFDCYSPFTLLSVLVFSNAAGNRTITFEDSTGAVLQTATVNIGTGTVRVPLNFTITPGIKYRLHCAAPNNLYRNSGSGGNGAGISFPYGTPGVVSIWSGDNYDNTQYNFFYDWKIATVNSTCPSSLVAVTGVVEVCTGLGEDVLFHQSIGVYPNPNKGDFNVSFETRTQENIQIQILDMIGSVVYTKDVKNVIGKYKGEINARDLAKGFYMVSIKYQGKPYNTKLVIE